MKRRSFLAVCSWALALPCLGQYKVVNPKVSKIVREISEAHVTETLKKLEGFGTRYLYPEKTSA
jgi:hypothetical protein